MVFGSQNQKVERTSDYLLPANRNISLVICEPNHKVCRGFLSNRDGVIECCYRGLNQKKKGVRPTHFTKAQNDRQNDGASNLFVRCVGLTPMLS
jgi:hypothetical protein